MAGDSRLHLDRLFDRFKDKTFPVHGTFFLGELALSAFIGLVATGIFLGLFYEPSTRMIQFQNASVPAAYASVLQIDQLSVGLLVRRIHHWSAHIMIAAIVVHMARVYFTGAYKKPRDINWLVGSILLQLTILAAFIGYLLPYDEFSVTATSIGYQIMASIPWIGDVISQLGFGGPYPNPYLVPRFFTAHILLVPLLLAGLIGLHLLILLKLKHTQDPDLTQRLKDKASRVGERGLVGVPLWPEQAVMTGIIFLSYAAGVTLLASFQSIHPVQVYGPPTPQTPVLRPDWYLLWIYGVLKLIPAVELHVLGATITPEFIGGIVFPGIVFVAIMAVPFVDARITGDVPEDPSYAEIDHLSDRPGRTAIGIGAIAFFIMAGLSGYLELLPFGAGVMRILLVGVPILVGAVSYGAIINQADSAAFGQEESTE